MVLQPSKKTLRAYTGSSTADVSVTELVKQRLLMEKRNLNAQQLKGHLKVYKPRQSKQQKIPNFLKVSYLCSCSLV